MIERFSRTIASSHTRFWPLTQALFLYLSIYLYVYIYLDLACVEIEENLEKSTLKQAESFANRRPVVK